MSDAATALWVRAGSYSAAKLTDGFVAEHVVITLSKSPQDAADELRRRGLWHKVRGGYRFHQWEERGNLTRERVESDRKADRERKKAQRTATKADRGSKNHSSSPPVDNFGTQPEVEALNTKRQVRGHNVRPDSQRSPPGFPTESERIPGVSVSVSVSESESGAGRGAADVPTEPRRVCADHANLANPPPCGGCADARRNHDHWRADRDRRLTAAPRCPTHPTEIVDNCRCCAADRKAAA